MTILSNQALYDLASTRMLAAEPRTLSWAFWYGICLSLLHGHGDKRTALEETAKMLEGFDYDER